MKSVLCLLVIVPLIAAGKFPGLSQESKTVISTGTFSISSATAVFAEPSSNQTKSTLQQTCACADCAPLPEVSTNYFWKLATPCTTGKYAAISNIKIKTTTQDSFRVYSMSPKDYDTYPGSFSYYIAGSVNTDVSCFNSVSNAYIGAKTDNNVYLVVKCTNPVYNCKDLVGSFTLSCVSTDTPTAAPEPAPAPGPAPAPAVITLSAKGDQSATSCPTLECSSRTCSTVNNKGFYLCNNAIGSICPSQTCDQDCSQYTSCSACAGASNANCGWCPSMGKCLAGMASQSTSSLNVECNLAKSNWQYSLNSCPGGAGGGAGAGSKTGSGSSSTISIGTYSVSLIFTLFAVLIL